MAFGFGLPPGAIRPEDLARLFSPDMLGAPQGFGGSAGVTLPTDPREVPLPPQRPVSFDAPPTSYTGLPGQGGQQKVRLPEQSMSPTTPAPLSLAPPQQPVAAPASPAASESSLGEGIGDALGRFRTNGGFDMLGALGIGLLSSPTWAGGLASGLAYGDQQQTRRAATDLARSEQQLKVAKLRREMGGENATKQYFLRMGLGEDLATAAMTNPSVLSSVMNQLNKDPSRVTIGGNVYELRAGERPSEANLLGPAQGDRENVQLVPRPDGSILAIDKSKIGAGAGTGAEVAPPTSKLSNEVEQRRQALISQGANPDDPRNRDFILTGKMPKEDQQQLTAGDKKAILEADETVASTEAVIGNLRQAKELSRKAYEGPAAGMRGYGASLFGAEGGLATVDLDNLVTTNALGQLKSIFGAAPTEGERKILLDIQGSSSLPDAARQTIYDRAITLAERRLQLNRERAAEMRGGTYYRSDGGPAAPGVQRQGQPQSTNDQAREVMRGVAQPRSKSDYDALPSGAQYIAPDGSRRTKP